MLFYELEPFGTDIEMYGHAMVASTLLNIYRDRKKHPTPITPKDVMPEWDNTDIVQKQAEQIRQFNALFGGKEVKHGHSS